MASVRRLRSNPESAIGFSLIDIMVGLLIAAIAIAAMLQIYAVAEGQKRAVTGGSDAQTNGAIALYQLQQEISQAGYGISNLTLFGCTLSGTLLPAGTKPTIAPVMINPPAAIIPAGTGTSAVDPNTDTLLIMYGNSGNSPEGDGISAQPSTSVYTVQTPTSFKSGEYVFALAQSPTAPCSLTLNKITAIDTVAQTITVSTGVAGMANGKLYDLGNAPKIVGYAVRNSNLTMCDYLANDCSNVANWKPIISNIVRLRAEYGQDGSDGTTMDAVIKEPEFNNTLRPSTPPTSPACNFARISALRFVVVARSNHLERNLILNNKSNPAWMGSSSAPIDLSNSSTNTNWGRYRYELFQTVAPLRNISWLGVQSGC